MKLRGKARPKIRKRGYLFIVPHSLATSIMGKTIQSIFCYSPGLYKEAGGLVRRERGLNASAFGPAKLFDHPLATAYWLPRHRPHSQKDVCDAYKGEKPAKTPEMSSLCGKPCHHALLENGIMGYENVGGDIDKVVGKRGYLKAGFPNPLD